MLGLADDFAFTAAHTSALIKFSFTGPFSLARRIRTSSYPHDRDLVLSLAHILNAEARALADRGAELLQIDEPFLAGYPEHVADAVEAINIVTEGTGVTWALHVCYGNRYSRPLWQGHYDFLFPAVLDAAVDQLVLEFARKGYDDLPVIRKSGWDRTIGLGVVDVKSTEVETPGLIADRIRRAAEIVPADRLVINPDCGLRNLPGPVARANSMPWSPRGRRAAGTGSHSASNTSRSPASRISGRHDHRSGQEVGRLAVVQLGSDDYLFTSESVTEGHPDKVADAISDAVLDAALAVDPYSRVACETLVTTGMVVLAGEITTPQLLDYPQIVRDTLIRIGYDDPDCGFDGRSFAVIVALDKQSPDIAQGVDEAHEYRGGGCR